MSVWKCFFCDKIELAENCIMVLGGIPFCSEKCENDQKHKIIMVDDPYPENGCKQISLTDLIEREWEKDKKKCQK